MKFPKEIFISLQGEGDDAYLLAQETAEDAMDGDGPIQVAEYKLVGVAKLEKKAQKVK